MSRAPQRCRIDHSLGGDHVVSVPCALRVEHTVPLARQIKMPSSFNAAPVELNHRTQPRSNSRPEPVNTPTRRKARLPSAGSFAANFHLDNQPESSLQTPPP